MPMFGIGNWLSAKMKYIFEYDFFGAIIFLPSALLTAEKSYLRDTKGLFAASLARGFAVGLSRPSL